MSTMRHRHLSIVGTALLLVGTVTGAEAPPLPPADKVPVLRLEAGGPTSFVTALAFSPDGQLLYAAGWDKVVRVWALKANGEFVLDPKQTYRVPLGPGDDGAINALALSDRGTWLAVGGKGKYRGAPDFRMGGWIEPSVSALDADMRQDQGMIHVFNTQTGAVRLLRGHRGTVAALAFAPGRAGRPPLLVSAAREWDPDLNQYRGAARLWDVDKGEQLDWNWVLTADPRTLPRPSLAVWYSAGTGKELQAALTWGDGFLHVWDIGTNRVRRIEDETYNPLVVLPERDRVLTAAFGADLPRLRGWDVRPGKDPKEALPLSSVGNGSLRRIPRALGLVSAEANGRTDHVAAVTVAVKDKDAPNGHDYRLQLLSTASQTFGRPVGQEVALWQGENKQPVLATCPGGRHLAVAGNGDQTIQVYRVRDLLNGKPQKQTLRSAGTTVRYAAFVRQGKDTVGLLLNERDRKNLGSVPRGPAKGDLVFDPGKRRLAEAGSDWKSDAPNLGEWQAKLATEEGKLHLAVVRGNQVATKIPLPSKWEVTDFALLPPLALPDTPLLATPLLALAYQEAGQPVLCLYNALSGERVRELVGHTDRITCVAFAGDGRLLVSAAEDQTVCVWRLTTLGEVLGKQGLLPRVVIDKKKEGLVVTKVFDDSPARGLLQPDEVVAGIVRGEKLSPLDTPRAFFDAIGDLKPGEKVVLRVQGAQGQRDVTLPVGQRVDQRKPLFSLFLFQDDREATRRWVAWNPVGPYEASDAKAEEYVGWHFNTGEAAEPSRFARINLYHDYYYREGLVEQMLLHPEVDRLPPPPPPRKPKMTLGVEDEKAFPKPDGAGQVLVRHPKVTLHVQVAERPLNTLDAVTWRIDDEKAQVLDLSGPSAHLLSAPLQLSRGLHRVVVTAHAPEMPGDVYREEILVRYQPPPPRLDFTGERQPRVEDMVFKLNALVSPGAAGEAVTVQLSQPGPNNEWKEIKSQAYPELPADKPAPFTADVPLQLGTNVLRVVAVNKNALAGFVEGETSKPLFVEVFRKKAKAAPPVIALEGAFPMPGEGEPQRGLSVRVGVPRVRLTGKIDVKGDEPLAKVEWFEGEGKVAKPLAGAAGKKQWAFEEAVDLRPGPQQFHVRAKTETSDEVDSVLTVYYQPPVPEVRVFTAPREGQVFTGEKETAEVEVTALLSLPEPPQPHAARVLLDGKPLDGAPPPTIDAKARTLTTRVSLHPGGNSLQLQFRNEWGALSTSAPLQVRYLRPPQVVRLKVPEKTTRPVLDLEAEVRSPLPLRPDTVKVEVNGRERPAKVEVAAQQPAPGTWTVLLREVTLDPGGAKWEAKPNELRLRLSNAEAECPEPGRATVLFRPVVPPPEVRIVEPADNMVVNDPELVVSLWVRSASPLTRVQVIREGDEPLAVKVGDIKPGPAGAFELKQEVEVTGLTRGLNTVRVVAANEGSEQSSSLLLANYVPRPVRLVIDDLVPTAGGAAIAARREPGRKLTFDAAPSGRVRLRGRILWNRPEDAQARKPRVVAYVNGFQQGPQRVPPAAAGGRESRFEVDLLLNQGKDNQVVVTLPDLPVSEGDRAQFSVDCKDPGRFQRLHLLLVSPQKAEGPALLQQFDKAFGVATQEGQRRTKAFEDVPAYPPLTGDRAARRYVNQALLELQVRINNLALIGQSNDLIVFYYQGREKVDGDGNVFLTGLETRPEESRDTAIRADDLADIFADTAGAHILLLDVDRAAPADREAARDKVARWDTHYPRTLHNVSVVRYAWLGRAEGPRDIRLVRALEEGMAQAVTWLDVTNEVRRVAEGSPDYKKGLKHDEYIAVDMRTITVGR
jgi:WD40 repeat protein